MKIAIILPVKGIINFCAEAREVPIATTVNFLWIGTSRAESSNDAHYHLFTLVADSRQSILSERHKPLFAVKCTAMQTSDYTALPWMVLPLYLEKQLHKRFKCFDSKTTIHQIGVRGNFLMEIYPRDCGFTNRGTMGLISVDRKTSLLSYLQYPVPYLSRLQRI
jgi:hypothetical protein